MTDPPRRRLPPWSWPGVVATILAASVGLGWCAAIIASAISPHQTSAAGINLLNGLGQTLAGAVAAFLGYQVGFRGHADGITDERNRRNVDTTDDVS